MSETGMSGKYNLIETDMEVHMDCKDVKMADSLAQQVRHSMPVTSSTARAQKD